MRGAFYFLDHNKDIEAYLSSIFKAYWTDGSDISDDQFLKELADSHEVSSEEFLNFINLPETKARLIENTQELMTRGGFGSPTFFVNEEDMYFGNDRIQLIEKLL